MKRIIPPRFRYPLFLAGLLIIIASGYAHRYAGAPLWSIEISVTAGFLLFLASIVA